MSKQLHLALVSVVLALCPITPAVAILPTQETVSYVNAVEGRRAVVLGEGVFAFYGATLAVDAVPGTYETTDDFVAAYVESIASAIDVAAADLIPDKFCTGHPSRRCTTDNDCDTGQTCHHRLDLRNGKFALYYYFQRLGGIRVNSSALRVLVLLDTSEERIGYAAGVVIPTPQPPLPDEDEISATDAFHVVETAHPELTVPQSADAAEKVVYEALDGTLHRTWSFEAWDDTQRYQFFVNTTNESIVGQVNLVAEFEGTVTVKAWQSLCCHPGRPDWPACCPPNPTDCCCDESHEDFPCTDKCCGWNAPGIPTPVAPLPAVQVTLTQDTCAVNPANESQWENDWFTDHAGVFDFSNCTESACTDGNRTTARLVGPNVTVLHPTCSNPANICTDHVLRVPTCVTASGSNNVVFEYPVEEEQNPTLERTNRAAVNSFLATQQTINWIRDLQPSLYGIDQRLTVKIGGANSSANISGTTINVSRKETDFGGTATILSHEVGHFLESVLLGSTNLEDVADAVGMLMWDTPCIAFGTRTSGCYKHFDPEENDRFPGSGVGGKNYVLNQAIWDFRKELLRCEVDTGTTCSTHGDCDLGTCDTNDQCTGDGRPCADDEDCRIGLCTDRLVDELFLDALPLFIAGRTTEQRLHLAMLGFFAVDDDDADMTSDPPTPHFEELYQSFVIDHGFPDLFPPLSGDGSVKVEWSGPLTAPSESEDDYAVHYNFVPPIVELLATQKGGVDVEAWFVGRMVDGEPADLGWVKRDTSGDSDIVVQIGATAQTLCRTSHFIQVAAEDGDKFSNIRLDLTGNLGAWAYCESFNDSGTRKGGRIEGRIAGDVTGVQAEAIGTGASSGGILDGGVLRKVTLQSISPSTVTEPQNRSTLSARESTGTVDVLGSTTGSILVDDDISGRITVNGTMTGDLMADWDVNGEGVISGSVTVTGAFTGNICDANMANTGQLASNISLGGGSQYTVCATRPPLQPPAPHTATKNRYLSIRPHANYPDVALKVRLDSMKRCQVDEAIPCDDAGDCPSGECEEHEDVNEEWWVAEPFDASCQDDEYNYLTDPPNCTGVDFVARLTGEPVSLDWSAYPVLHIADCQIVPTATYAITAYDETAEEESTELLVSTIARPDSKFYGDVVGALTSSGWTPPQGVVNITDIQAVILAFQGVPTAPHRTWVDIFGPHDGSVPDFHIDTTDLDLVVDAFTGANWLAGEYHLYPGDCPSTKTAIQPIGSAVAFSLDVSSGFIDPEEPVYVDVFIGSVDDLGAYEVALEVTGGTEGWLILTDITVDTQRGDYVFGTGSSYIAANLAEARVGNVLASGGVSVTGPKYVATFTYQPSEGATGAFEFAMRDSSFSYLNDCDGRRLAVDAGTNEVIGVGLDCFVNGDCDDFNACTTDTCDDGACYYANVNQGTSCNDGLFCTAVDQCNGQGACVGGMLTPCTEGQTCDELGDQCWTLAGSIPNSFSTRNRATNSATNAGRSSRSDLRGTEESQARSRSLTGYPESTVARLSSSSNADQSEWALRRGQVARLNNRARIPLRALK